MQDKLQSMGYSICGPMCMNLPADWKSIRSVTDCRRLQHVDADGWVRASLLITNSSWRRKNSRQKLHVLFNLLEPPYTKYEVEVDPLKTYNSVLSRLIEAIEDTCSIYDEVMIEHTRLDSEMRKIVKPPIRPMLYE